MVTISPHKACLMNQTEIASDGYGQCDGLCVDRHGYEACIASLFLVPSHVFCVFERYPVLR